MFARPIIGRLTIAHPRIVNRLLKPTIARLTVRPTIANPIVRLTIVKPIVRPSVASPNVASLTVAKPSKSKKSPV